jgi:predicted nucleic acid-binding protein
MIERKDELITSSMTLAEVQVKALRQGNIPLAHSFRDAIRDSSRIANFDEAAANIFASLRVNPAIRPADAIQLSCAAAVGVELFITNDTDLQRLNVPGIHFICSVERAPV